MSDFRRRALAAEAEVERLSGEGYRERRALASEAEAGRLRAEVRLRAEDSVRFNEYLKRVSAEVKTWPEWQRNCLRPYKSDD